MIKNFMRSFFKANQRASALLDSLLPASLRIDGNRHFIDQVIPAALEPGSLVYDIGGGSQPCISVINKSQKSITLVGLDISDEELNLAPSGAYDRKIAADLMEFRGDADADVIICQAVLEHVPNNSAAAKSLSSIVKKGGIVYVFVPCRNALYARLNIILPEKFKNKILELVQPGLTEHQGFQAYYDKCTPKQMQRALEASGFEVIQLKKFWMSSYFGNFLPAHILWRAWQFIFSLAVGGEACETFILVARKRTKTITQDWTPPKTSP